MQSFIALLLISSISQKTPKHKWIIKVDFVIVEYCKYQIKQILLFNVKFHKSR